MTVTFAQIEADCPVMILGSNGDLDVEVSCWKSPEKGIPDSLLFLETKQAFVDGTSSQAQAMIVNVEFAEEIQKLEKSALFTKNVSLLMSKVIEKYFGWNFHRKHSGHQIHPSAHICPSAEIGQNTIIGPNVVIGENVTIGSNGFIGANSVIEDNVSIGDDCTIHPLVYIAHGCQLGNAVGIHPNTSIGSEGYGFAHDEKGQHWRIQQTGTVVLEDRVEIGSNCAIDRGSIEATVIGEGSKLDNLCHIGHNVTFGKNCMVTAGFATAGSARFGNNFVCGGHTSSAGHLTVCDNVHVAGRSVIHNNVTEPGVYGGHPLEPVKDYLRTTKSLAQLTAMRKTLSRIAKKIGQEDT